MELAKPFPAASKPARRDVVRRSSVQGKHALRARAKVPTLEECYPASTKEYDQVPFNGYTINVPKRRVHLQEGAPEPGYVDLYDTSGPQWVRRLQVTIDPISFGWNGIIHLSLLFCNSVPTV